MSNYTTHLIMPLIEAAQAQKHITHNEALNALDTLVQLCVISDQITTPPAQPGDGDRYIVPNENIQGKWSGSGKKIAAYQSGIWKFYNPREGWMAWVKTQKKLVVYDQEQWKTLVQMQQEEEQ